MSSVLFSNKAFGKYKKESDEDDSGEEEEENQIQRPGPPKASTEVRTDRPGIKSPTSEFDYDDLFEKPGKGAKGGEKGNNASVNDNGRSASGVEKSAAAGGLSATSGALHSQGSSINSGNATDDGERGNGASAVAVKLDLAGSSSSQHMNQNSNNNSAKRHQRSSVTYSTTSPMLAPSGNGRPKDVVNSSAFARGDAVDSASPSTKPAGTPKDPAERKPPMATANTTKAAAATGAAAQAAAEAGPNKEFATIDDFFADDSNSNDEFDEGVFEERSLAAGPATAGKPVQKTAVAKSGNHLADTSDSSSNRNNSSDSENDESKPNAPVANKVGGTLSTPTTKATPAKATPAQTSVVTPTTATTTNSNTGAKADNAAEKRIQSVPTPAPAKSANADANSSDSDASDQDEDIPFAKNTQVQSNPTAVPSPAVLPSTQEGSRNNNNNSSGGSNTNPTNNNNNNNNNKVPVTTVPAAASTNVAIATSSKSALLEAATVDRNNSATKRGLASEKPLELFDSSDDDGADAHDQQQDKRGSNGSKNMNGDDNATETDVSQSLSAVTIVKPPSSTASTVPVVGVAPPPPAPAPPTAAAAATRSTRVSTTSDGLPVFVVPSTKDLSSVVAAEAKLNSYPIDASVVRPIASYSVKSSKGSSMATNDTDSSFDGPPNAHENHDDGSDDDGDVHDAKPAKAEPMKPSVVTPKQPEKSSGSPTAKDAKEKVGTHPKPPERAPDVPSTITFRPMSTKGEKPFSDDVPPVQINIAHNSAQDDDTFDQYSEPGGSPLLPHETNGTAGFNAQPMADLRTPVTFITAKETAIPASRRAVPSRPGPPATLPPINFVQAIGFLIRDAGTWAHAGSSSGASGAAHHKKKSSKGFFGKLMGLCSSSSSTTEAVSEPSPKNGGRPTEDSLRVHLATCARDGGVEFLEALLHLQLDHTNNIHRRIFISMCRRLLRMAPDANDPPTRNSQCWERIGFQGEDPATDLRSTGMLGPTQVLYLMDAFPPLTANMWNICTSNPSAELPFVLVCFNMTGIVVEAYKMGKLKKEISERVKVHRMRKGQDSDANSKASPSNRTAAVEPPRPGTSPATPNDAAPPATAPPVIEVLCELFVGSVAVFIASWKKLPDTPTVREFGKVKATVKEYVMKNISETMKKGAVKP